MELVILFLRKKKNRKIFKKEKEQEKLEKEKKEEIGGIGSRKVDSDEIDDSY